MEDCFHLGVKALIQNANNHILLLQLPSQNYDLPGGRIQRGESLENALTREVYEETGLTVRKIRYLSMALSKIRIPAQNSDVGLIFAIHLCELVSESPILLSKEHINFAWVKPEKAIGLLPNPLTSELIKLRDAEQF